MMRISIVLVVAFLWGGSAFSQDNNWRLFPRKKNKKAKEVVVPVPVDSVVQPVETAPATPVTASPKALTKDTTRPEKAGRVELVEEYRITALLELADSLNKAKGTIPGYRIQIAAETGAQSHARAKEIQSDFLRAFPAVPSYVLWENPNYKVRIGDFRTRLSAQGFHQEVRQQFPGAFVLPDDIQLPDLNAPVEVEPVEPETAPAPETPDTDQ